MTNATGLTGTGSAAGAPVALLGLGPMGTAMAQSWLAAGVDLTVWNRSDKDFAALGLAQARPVVSAADAVGQASIVAICVRDHAVARELLEQIAPALRTEWLKRLMAHRSYVGANHAQAPVLDMAMLNIYFAGMHAFLQSAAIARAYGIEPEEFVPYGQGIAAALADSLPGLGMAYGTRRYDSGEARLDMCRSFLAHIARPVNLFRSLRR